MRKILAAVGLAMLVGLYLQLRGKNFDPKIISGKRVLITGASSGIGEHIAYQYSKLGAIVFITARREDLLEKVAKKCKDLGAKRVEFAPLNMAEVHDREKLVLQVKERLGGLDHLILNHAVLSAGLWLGTKENMTVLQNDLNLNFISYVDVVSQSLSMLTDSKGSIGVVSSILGKFGMMALSPYCTAKFAINGFFTVLRQELRYRGTGVSVTTCLIGPVDTDLVKYTKERNKEIQEEMFGYDFRETPENTAVAILAGVANREYEIAFGRFASVLLTIYKFFPETLESYFGRSS